MCQSRRADMTSAQTRLTRRRLLGVDPESVAAERIIAVHRSQVAGSLSSSARDPAEGSPEELVERPGPVPASPRADPWGGGYLAGAPRPWECLTPRRLSER